MRHETSKQSLTTAAGRASALCLLSVLLGCSITLDERVLLPGSRHAFQPISDAFRRQNVEIAVQNGGHLRGWFIDNPNAKRAIVYYYGNGGRVLTSMVDIYAMARKLEASVLCVDYRGYGFSDGTPSFDYGRADALAVFDHFTGNLNPRGLPVFALGWSLGTALATHVGATRDTAGVILLAPPTSVRDMVEAFNDKLPWFASLFFDLEADPRVLAMEPQPVDEIAQIAEPVLVVHGTSDEIVPFRMGKKMHARAGTSEKTLCVLKGAGHQLSYGRVPAIHSCVQPFVDRNTAATAR